MEQLTFEREMGLQLDRFDRRLEVLRLYGLRLWVGVLRRVMDDLIAARLRLCKGVCQEAMQLESVAREIENADVRAKVFVRLEKIKTLVAVGCLAIVLAALWGGTDEKFLRLARGRRRRDEEALVC